LLNVVAGAIFSDVSENGAGHFCASNKVVDRRNVVGSGAVHAAYICPSSGPEPRGCMKFPLSLGADFLVGYAMSAPADGRGII